MGFLLKALGRKVIYDVHEDTPRQVLNKYWMPRAVRLPAFWAMSALEWIGGRVFDALVVATPQIAKRFPSSKTTVVHNFPLLGELTVGGGIPYAQRANAFIYVGRIAEIRGAREMVRAIGLLDERYGSRLDLAGAYGPARLETDLRSIPGWSRTRSLGWAKRDRVAQLLSEAKVGLVLLHPTHSYPDAYPVKMFEYMAAGLPVIASDFPLWREIVEDAECGLLVDPLDPAEIAEAMNWLLKHGDEAEAMGRRGKKAVEDRYNWQAEAGKLRQMYRELLRLT